MKNFFFLIAMLNAIFIIPSAFAQSYKLDPEIRSQLLKGDLVLKSSVFGRGAADGPELRVLHDSGKWEELVAAVVSKKF